MNKKEKIWLLIVLLLTWIVFALSSCGSKKAVIPENTINSRYEYKENIVIKDTFATLQVPELKQINTALFFSMLENDFAKSESYIDSLTGLLHHTLEQKQQVIEIPIKITEKETFQRNDTVMTIYLPVPVIEYKNELKNWQIILMCLGGVFIILIIFFVAKRFQ